MDVLNDAAVFRDEETGRTQACPWPRLERPRAALTGRRWHVVHTVNPRDEDIDQALKNAEYPFYDPQTFEMRAVPKRQLTPKHRNSPIPVMKRTRVPLFPRYRFVQLDINDGRWGGLFELIGIQGILCSEEYGRPQPCPVDDLIIAALVAKEIDGLIPGSVTVRALAFEIGEQVRINNGAFAGFTGSIEEIPDKPLEQLDGTERLTLLVSLFGRSTPIELAIADVEKL